MNKLRCVLRLTAVAGLLAIPLSARASSHMDAPLITLDDAANTTDVYAFVSQKYRPAISHDRSRGVPARGTGCRSQQVQLR